MSYPLLEQAPKDHNSPEFLEFLRKNNTVVWETDDFVVVENCKYHRPDRAWYTAFYSHEGDDILWEEVDIRGLIQKFGWLTWLKKPPHKQTVKRWHIHMYEE